MDLFNMHSSHAGRKPKFFVGFFVLIFTAMMFTQLVSVPAQADHDPFGGVEQTSVLFCHALGNGGFNEPNSSVTATGGQVDIPQGHAGHEDDIIPPFHYNGGSYPGQNWTPENEDIWNSGSCDGDGVLEPATLVINKAVINDNSGAKTASDFSFQVNGGEPVAFEAGGQNNLTVDAGIYSITEVAVDGYFTTYENCTDIVLGEGGTATCTITNNDVAPPANPIIEIQKIIDGDGNPDTTDDQNPAGGWEFNVGGNEVSTNGGGTTGSVELESGVYSVTETVQAGYSLVGASCTGATNNGELDGNGITGIQADSEQSVVCTFYNSPLGTIKTTKDIVPNSDNWFGFEWNFGNFSLSDNMEQFLNVNDSEFLSPGVYTISEEENLDYNTSVSCQPNGENGQSSVEVNLGYGENVTCTFTNTIKQGGITIIKQTNPDSSQQPFEFDLSWNEGNLSLVDNDGGQNFQLDPGSYSVEEVNIPFGWDLTDVSCFDQDDNEQDFNDLELVSDGSIACVFTNTQRGQIIVEKQTNPGGSEQVFTFVSDFGGEFGLADGQQFESILLSPGTYSVSEVNLPESWEQSGVSCSDESDPSAIDLSAGETVTCVFSNTFVSPPSPSPSPNPESDLAPPQSTFDDTRDHQIIDTELVSLSLTGYSVDLPQNNASGVASAEMRIYQLADEATMLSDSFFDITYREMSCLDIPQEQVPIEIVALNLTSVDPIPITATWDYKNKLNSENNSEWTIPGRGVYCAIVNAVDKATPIPNVEHTGTSGPFAYNPPPSPTPTPTPSPTPTPTPTPEPPSGGGGGGGGPQGEFINGPLANPPQVAGASTVAPQVAGALSVLPSTGGTSLLSAILTSLFMAIMATGALMAISPRKVLEKVR